MLFSRLCIPIILLVSVWVSANLKWGENQRKYVVISDGKGYYAYLPATFVYHDMNMMFFDSIEAKYYDENTRYQYRTAAHGKVIDKYFAGVAVMQAPFFLAGHFITLMSDEPADGYSKWYIIAICIGSIFWLGIGLFYLRKYLRLHGASEVQSAAILFLIFFGTNLFYYSLVEPCMSHLYSFTLVSTFLYFGKKWIDSGNKKSALMAAIVFGMIFLVRPVNILAGLWLIYEAGGFQLMFLRIKEICRKPSVGILSLLLLLFPFTIQMIIWKIQTGHWLVNSYGDESFHFLNPHLTDFLFSYKKGLFVYLPITLVSLFGFASIWKRDRKRAVIALTFFLSLFYILSSWWMWYYGGSFGTRVIVEFLPMFALLLFFFLRSLKTKLTKAVGFSLVILLSLFCQFQTHQYRYLIIHWSEMTKEKYWEVFGKVP